MTTKRKQYSNQFKFKVALEAIKELQTIHEIASTHRVYPSQADSSGSHLNKKEAIQGFQPDGLNDEKGQPPTAVHDNGS